jgi:hypothetical protein
LAAVFVLYGILILVGYIAKRYRGNDDDELIRFRPSLLRGDYKKYSFKDSRKSSTESEEEHLDSVSDMKSID